MCVGGGRSQDEKEERERGGCLTSLGYRLGSRLNPIHLPRMQNGRLALGLTRLGKDDYGSSGPPVGGEERRYHSITAPVQPVRGEYGVLGWFNFNYSTNTLYEYSVLRTEYG